MAGRALGIHKRRGFLDHKRDSPPPRGFYFKQLVIIEWLIVSRVAVTIDGVFDWIYWPLYTHNSGLQAITVLSLIYTLYSSPLPTHHGSQSSLVVSWQRIYNSLSLQITHVVFFSQLNSFLAIILQLPTQFNSSAPKLIYWQAGVSKLDSTITSQSHIATDGQSVNKSCYRAPSGAHDQIFITVWQLRSCFLWGALSDERTGLSLIYAAGSCQSSLSWVRVPLDSRPYFTVSDLRLPFLSPPTTRRVTVEVL
jgi:hypothetical protein